MKKLTQFYAKRTKGERRILFITVLFLGFAFVDRVIVLPIVTTLSTLSQSVKEQENSIKKSMTVLLHKDNIIAENREYVAYSVEAKNAEEEMVGLLQEIESVADRSGVSLIFVKPGTVKEEKGIKKYYANLECEAPMEQVATFFHDIESSNKIIKIEKYQIQPKSKESSIARTTVSVYKTVLS
jgi:Tfp pilus assembly protein PilO